MSAILELTTDYEIVTTKAQLTRIATNYNKYRGYTIVVDAKLQEDARTKTNTLLRYMIQQSKRAEIAFVIIGNRETRYDKGILNWTNIIRTIRSNK